jgi:hypothetical protein
MDVPAAYREVGSYLGAAVISGTTHKTMKGIVAAHEVGGQAPARSGRGHDYDTVADLVARKVAGSQGRLSAKRLLLGCRAAGYAGSARNFRRLVADAKAALRAGHHRGRGPAVWGAG